MAGSVRIRHSAERALFERLATDGDPHARDALVEQYLPLARSLALRYQRSYETIDDLLQVAALGLVKAVDGFDPHRGIAFTSYAVPTILGEIKRHFRDRTWALRLPRELQERSLRVGRAVDELTEQLQRQPSAREIAAALCVDVERVLEALRAGGAQRTLSFDAPRRGGEEVTTLAESIGAYEPGFDRAEERATIQALMAMLTEREREVLRMRFAEDLTQTEIGAIVGISQMHVSRIIRHSLGRLHAVAEHHARQLVLD
jgi:RNA polymerase sigma-B factor